MWRSRITLDRVERTANIYAPLVNMGLIYCWMFGALIPIFLVTFVSMLLQEAGFYFNAVFADENPDSFGTLTAHVIVFSNHFAFFDASLFANPVFLLRGVISIGASIWLVVRLLRYRIGMPELMVFCAQRQHHSDWH